ncbi:MAG: small multi-drug export protein [Patescibacteria group bacterium]
MREAITTILLAMSPTLEAHGAIVAASGLFKFSPVKTYVLTLLGSGGIVIPLLILWHKIAETLMARFYLVNRFLTWLFSYTKRKHIHHFAMFGELDESSRRAALWKSVALYIFVAIPGPFTGVWAGSVAAFVFGIPFWHAAVALILGAATVAAIDLAVLAGFLKLIG